MFAFYILILPARTYWLRSYFRALSLCFFFVWIRIYFSFLTYKRIELFFLVPVLFFPTSFVRCFLNVNVACFFINSSLMFYPCHYTFLKEFSASFSCLFCVCVFFVLSVYFCCWCFLHINFKYKISQWYIFSRLSSSFSVLVFSQKYIYINMLIPCGTKNNTERRNTVTSLMETHVDILQHCIADTC